VTEEKDPIHKRCFMHDDQCDNMSDIKKELIRVWDAIDKFVKAKTLMWLMGTSSVAFLALFGYSVQMNHSAIEGSVSRDAKQQVSIDSVITKQNNVLVEIRGLKGQIHEVQTDVEEMKIDRRRKN